MDPGTVFAIIQFADQCLKYGEKLVRRCQNYRHAEEEARQLLINIEVNWMKTEAQITFLKHISYALDPRYRDVQSRVLSELEGKLKTATLTMDQLISHEKEAEKGEDGEKDKGKGVDFPAMVKALEKMAPRKKVKYAFKKESLEKIIDDLENWQRRFDPSWMLIMRMASIQIDQQLLQEEKKPVPQQTGFIMAAKGVRDAARESPSAFSSTTALVPHGGSSIFKPAKILNADSAIPIPFSSAFLCCLAESNEHVLVDVMVCNPVADIGRTTRDVRKLARVLSAVDPETFGLLSCIGVIKSFTRDPICTSDLARAASIPSSESLLCFHFLFSLPPLPLLKTPPKPKSLRALLLESNNSYPLNSRFDLAKQLTSSVLYVHSAQFVHKNVRPETIIVIEDEEGGKKRQFGSCRSFLVGFEKFRPEEGMTYRSSDGIWQHDLYRHPTRQGTQPEEDYQMRHDIYSLGVVLLELGLWQSFITFPPQPESLLAPHSNPVSQPADIDATTPDPSLALPSPLLQPHILNTANKDTRVRAARAKAMLVTFASTLLPSRMGQKYCDVVLLCLQCLDNPSPVVALAPGVVGEAGIESGSGGGEFDDFYDQDGIVIGVKYIEKILLRMQEISI